MNVLNYKCGIVERNGDIEYIFYACPICGSIIARAPEIYEKMRYTPCEHVRFHAYLSDTLDEPVWRQFGNWSAGWGRDPERMFCGWFRPLDYVCRAKKHLRNLPDIKAVDFVAVHTAYCPEAWVCHLFGFKDDLSTVAASNIRYTLPPLEICVN